MRAAADAQRKIAKDVAEIRKADEFLAQALDLLPGALQQRLLQVRRSISTRLVGIDRRAERRGEIFQQKETRGVDEKKRSKNNR